MTDWNYAPPPPPPGPNAPVRKPRRRNFAAAVISAVAVFAVGIGVGYVVRGGEQQPVAAAASSADTPEPSTNYSAYSEDPTEPSEAETSDYAAPQPELDPSDFKIKIKIRKKDCFGSAGCNVTFRVNPSYNGPEDITTGSWDITYVVRGGDDGAQTNTMTLEDGTFSFDSEELASTGSSSTKLKAKVTAVEIS